MGRHWNRNVVADEPSHHAIKNNSWISFGNELESAVPYLNRWQILRQILFPELLTIRINDSYVTPEMATDLLEHDLKKLGILFQRGRESFASRETQLREYLL